jgi:hypothetical protein
MDSATQVKSSYLLTAVGVALMAVIAVFDSVRAMMFRPAFRSGFNATRQFANPNGNPMGFGFGFTSGFAILAVVVALVGVIWLGLALRKPAQSKTN